jgi:hypothetical protein
VCGGGGGTACLERRGRRKRSVVTRGSTVAESYACGVRAQEQASYAAKAGCCLDSAIRGPRGHATQVSAAPGRWPPGVGAEGSACVQEEQRRVQGVRVAQKQRRLCFQRAGVHMRDEDRGGSGSTQLLSSPGATRPTPSQGAVRPITSQGLVRPTMDRGAARPTSRGSWRTMRRWLCSRNTAPQSDTCDSPVYGEACQPI